MKKFIIAMSIAALTVSAYAMSKTPSDTKAPANAKACAIKDAACCTTDGSCKMGDQKAACAVKDAACCTTDGSCKMGDQKAAACPACKAAGGMCAACKAKTDAVKATEEKAGCTGSVCPLTK